MFFFLLVNICTLSNESFIISVSLSNGHAQATSEYERARVSYASLMLIPYLRYTRA